MRPKINRGAQLRSACAWMTLKQQTHHNGAKLNPCSSQVIALETCML
jgi:hypothetical protein